MSTYPWKVYPSLHECCEPKGENPLINGLVLQEKGCQAVIALHRPNDFTEVEGCQHFLFRHCHICNMNRVFAYCQAAVLSGSGGQVEGELSRFEEKKKLTSLLYLMVTRRIDLNASCCLPFV